ncbi:2-dehydropantoate 2-reductase [Nocardioides panacis]|uniref:2-dehydropantoate 2-reductase n=1 Tax=Nocardioides panacis TaxID=2849501 RepID=A0A975SWR0_9ACTN|nr:2-dehydropantoate 2-reductase [Nocardioides panacis]QWZ07345.1 2-dehydropantoate 2-reductase [Nocardioides panacis]
MDVKVTVVGAGGVGGYFGGRLVQSGVDVTFVARGAHLEALKAGGLHVRSIRGDFEVPVRATEDPAAGGVADYVLVTVKSYDTDRVASMLRPVLGDRSAVVSLQNGVDNEERLAAALGNHRVVGGAAYIFATLAEPGVVDHTGGPASLVVGEWSGGGSQRVASLVETFRAADVTADESPDIRAALWSKFAFICAQAGVTAAVRLPIGEIRSQPAGRALFRDLAAEVCAVAAAEGVELPADLPDRTLGFADALEPGGTSSLYHDLVHGRRMELDSLLGEVVRRGGLRSVDVPTSRAVYGVLQPWAARAQR